MIVTEIIAELFHPSQLSRSKLRIMKVVCICLTLFAVSFLIEEALGRRMSLRAKRKKVLRKYLEREAIVRNDTLMQRLLHEQSSKFDPNDPNKPPWPKSYEDISNYTFPPNLVPGTNESSVDNSDFVHEMVPDLTRKTTRRKSTTVKRNKTTSKYKKKLKERSSTTLSPEVMEAVKNFTTFSFLNLTPISFEENTELPFPHEKLDPKYYTYRSKAWTTTMSTKSPTVYYDERVASEFRFFRSSLFAVNITEFDPEYQDFWFHCPICKERYPSKIQLEVHQDWDHLDLFSPGRPYYPSSEQSDWMLDTIESYNVPPENYTYFVTKQTMLRDAYGNAYTLAMGRHSTTPPLYMQYVWD